MDLVTQPMDILVEIFKYIPSREIIRLRRVSKSMKLIVKRIISRPGIILNFSWTNVTDAGLVHLKGAHTIYLWGTKIMDAGIKYLRDTGTGTVNIYK